MAPQKQADGTAGWALPIDPERRVVHVGDIPSGKQYCTQAYDQGVFDMVKAFTMPLVYTPGDNEWADCHKSAEGGNVLASDDASLVSGQTLLETTMLVNTRRATSQFQVGQSSLLTPHRILLRASAQRLSTPRSPR